MKIFRVTYINNEVLSCCEEIRKMAVSAPYQYEHSNGKLIYALIRAKDEAAAVAVARSIIKEFKGKFPDGVIN